MSVRTFLVIAVATIAACASNVDAEAPASGPEFLDRGGGAPQCRIGEIRACDATTAAGAICAGTQTCVSQAMGELTRPAWSLCAANDGACVATGGTGANAPSGVTPDASAPDAKSPADTGPAPEAGPPPPPPPPACSEKCTGETRLIDQTAKYGVWVKVVLCSPTRYDILLGPTASGSFAKVGDLSGSGQDHCELVNPAFTMGADGAMNTGSCPSCEISGAGRAYLHPAEFGPSLYHRYDFGDQFSFEPNIMATTVYNADTSCWYECGIAF